MTKKALKRYRQGKYPADDLPDTRPPAPKVAEDWIEQALLEAHAALWARDRYLAPYLIDREN